MEEKELKFLLRYLCNNVMAQVILCHSYRLSPSNQASEIIFDNPISLKLREEMFIKIIFSLQLVTIE